MADLLRRSDGDRIQRTLEKWLVEISAGRWSDAPGLQLAGDSEESEVLPIVVH